MDLQSKMNRSFDNYLEMSAVLSEDLMQLLDWETESPTWRRTFVRHIAAMIEADSNCFQQLASIGLQLETTVLTASERKALTSSIGFSAADQVKYVLRAAYKMFELGNPPDFSEDGWVAATEVFEKRHGLMHPKAPNDLSVGDKEWARLDDGAQWLIREHFAVIRRLQETYGMNTGNAT